MTRAIQWTGIVVTLVVGAGIVWLYATQPRSIAELRTNAAVQANLYEVDRTQYDLAVAALRDKQYRIAIDRFRRADTAGKDPQTQLRAAASPSELGRRHVYAGATPFTPAAAAGARCVPARWRDS